MTDDNKENDAEIKRMDSYSFGIDYSMEWNEMIKNITPRAIFSVSSSINPWPVTFGLDVNFKSLFEIKPVMSYHYSTQFINKDYLYDITHLRIKLNREIGSGKLTFWTDIVSRIDKAEGMEEKNSDYIYIWADYKCKVFESDNGSVSIKPTIRYQTGKLDVEDYSRMKLELTTEIKFK